MVLRNWSRSLFGKLYKEDIYSYRFNRFFPVVKKYLGNSKGKLLDAACGFGNRYLKELQISKSYLVGIDIDPDVTKKNDLHDKFIIDDLHSFITEERFNAIISLNTWEHLRSPETVLKKFHHVLHSHGIVIIIAPQRFHYISIIERMLPVSAKHMAWRILKGKKRMPYPAFYNLCSEKSLSLAALRQNFEIEYFDTVEGPPLWFSLIPPLFILMCLNMALFNKNKIFKNVRSTFIAVLRKI
jgi:SAM-dependent methyltransferase